MSTSQPNSSTEIRTSMPPNESSTGEKGIEVEEAQTENAVDQEAKKGKRKTSKVWEDLTEVVINGVKKAKCNHCNIALKMSQGNPTTHLKRHIQNCTIRQASLSGKGQKQTILSLESLGNDNATLSSFKFDKEKSFDILAKMIIVHEYPFSIVDHELFILFCKSLNPRYDEVRRHTIKDRCVKVHQDEKKRLKKEFECIGKISLTSDLWTSNQTVGYMCLTGHYMNSDWRLQKCLLNFCLLPPPHTGLAISDKIFECLTEWGLEDKISTITLDNASANDAAVRCLQGVFSRRGKLYCGGKIFHVRCCAHILNLMVHDGLKVLGDAIESVRETVKHITLTPSRLHKFDEIVRRISLPTNKSLILDVPTRWNSTYKMLSRAILFKEAFPLYKQSEPSYAWLPSDDDWDRAEEVCQFLEIFDDVTKLFSGVYYPTSNLFFPEVWKIRKILDEKSGDPRAYLSLMVQAMRQKFDKYWGECSLLMTIGVVLDPRNKLKYIEFVFEKLYPPGKNDVDPVFFKKVDAIRSDIYDLYGEYVSKYASDENGGSGANGDNNDNSKAKSKSRSEFEMWAKKDGIAQPHKNEMDMYLEEGIYMGGDGKFDVLNWWKANTLKFPSLSNMARDILSIPITTVASESAFSAGGRVLDDHRSSLNAETVEALLTTRDWLRTSYGIGTSSSVGKS